MFNQKILTEKQKIKDRDAIVVSGLGEYSLRDTLECGQCFRYELICESEGYVEYMTVVGTALITVGQQRRGELIFYGATDTEFEEVIRPYFDLDTDYGKIREDILSRTDSKWLRSAAMLAGGIAILRQDPWETLFSFIVSQNNNIPRIRKIIKQLAASYGDNICLQNGIKKCPLSRIDGAPCEEKCKNCGSCYTFPRAHDVASAPERMLPSHPGFRYRYLLDAAERVASGKTDLAMIASKKSYRHTVESLKEIVGVGEKVASCTALFGFANLEAFPVDVWMKRAIAEYFDGRLDPTTLGDYAGVAQQYIFHYIRNLEGASN